MKKIDKFLIKSFIGPFIVTFFIAMFVFDMQFLWKYIDDLIGKGLEPIIILELLFYLSASVVPLALPVGILLASLMTFGNLGEHYELVAIKSSGISLMRFMRSLFVMAILFAGFAFCFSNYLLPKANLKFASLLYSVTRQKPALNIKPGIFYNGIDGYVMRIGRKDQDNQMIYDIKIHDHTSQRGNTNVLVAEKGEMKPTADNRFLTFQLYNGIQYEEPTAKAGKKKNYEFIRTKFEEYEMVFDLSKFDFQQVDEDLFKNNRKMLNVHQLLHISDSLTTKQYRQFDNFKKNLTPYFSFIKDTALVQPATQKIDSLLAKKSIVLDSISPFLASLTTIKKDQIKIIKRAEGLAKNVKGSIDISQRQVKSDTKKITRYMIEFHEKITLSLACIVLFLIGAPLGAIIRKGGLGAPMIIAILFFILYHISATIGKKMAEEMVVTPLMGMWAATVTFTAMGIFLTYKAAHDSAILNQTAYTQFFKRLIGVFTKKGKKA